MNLSVLPGWIFLIIERNLSTGRLGQFWQKGLFHKPYISLAFEACKLLLLWHSALWVCLSPVRRLQQWSSCLLLHIYVRMIYFSFQASLEACHKPWKENLWCYYFALAVRESTLSSNLHELITIHTTNGVTKLVANIKWLSCPRELKHLLLTLHIQ